MKFRTHSGAKKRFRAKPGGKIKKKIQGRRHLLQSKSSKRKRHMGHPTYVNPSNQYQVERQLGL